MDIYRQQEQIARVKEKYSALNTSVGFYEGSNRFLAGA
jgi:hypothetical protein